MNATRLYRLTGALLIVTALGFNIGFTLLQMTFDYPDILREPGAEVLQRFQAGGMGLIATWYAFALSAALFMPIAALMHRVLDRADAPYLLVATAMGVVAGLVQTLGLLRWPFLVPYLAASFNDPSASEATRAATLVVFEAFHRYAGMAVGEHLGYLTTGVWTILVGLAMLRAPIFRPWLGWAGVLAALGILSGLLEPAGIEAAATINALGYVLWSLWLITSGVFLLRARPQAAAVPGANALRGAAGSEA